MIKACVLRERLTQARSLVPAVLSLCAEYAITVVENDHGFQFRKAEYVLLWSPRTNKVSVQYRVPGHDRTIKFPGRKEAVQSPKIMQALQSLIEILK